MESQLIKTEEDYKAALTRIEVLFDAVPGSNDFIEAEFLIALVELYEDKHYRV